MSSGEYKVVTQKLSVHLFGTPKILATLELAAHTSRVLGWAVASHEKSLMAAAGLGSLVVMKLM